MKPKAYFLLMLAALILPTAAHAEVTPKVPVTETAKWMRALGDDFLVPGYAELAQQAQQLHQAVQGLCASPNAATLTHAQASWRTVARTWRRLEALPIGPTLERRSLRRFDFWPTRPAQIEEAVVRAPASIQALDDIGVSAQGLPALEYLLFDARPRAGSSAEHCRYAMRLAQAFVEEADILATAWRDWRAKWRTDPVDPAASKATLTDCLNALIGTLLNLRARKLEKAVQARNQRELMSDAWRSGSTRDLLLATYDGVQRVLLGKPSGIGLVSMLNANGHTGLAARLTDESHAVVAALRKLPGNLPTASAGALGLAYSTLGRLQLTLSVDVVDALGITLGFNETDGD